MDEWKPLNATSPQDAVRELEGMGPHWEEAQIRGTDATGGINVISLSRLKEVLSIRGKV